jgi:hypothetical protein
LLKQNNCCDILSVAYSIKNMNYIIPKMIDNYLWLLIN